MKKALYYAIRTNCLYSKVIAVTSEKGSGRWFGRDCRYNDSTNGRASDLRGRFETQEQAEACLTGVIAITNDYEAQRKVLSDKQTRLYREERDKVDAYITEEMEASKNG